MKSAMSVLVVIEKRASTHVHGGATDARYAMKWVTVYVRAPVSLVRDVGVTIPRKPVWTMSGDCSRDQSKSRNHQNGYQRVEACGIRGIEPPSDIRKDPFPVSGQSTAS